MITKTTTNAQNPDVLETVSMTYNDANRLETYNGQKVTYDAKGNMTKGPVDGIMQELTYDCRNRLVEAGGVRYTYDAENTRISTTENGLTTEYVTDTGGSLSRLLIAYEADNTQTTYYYGAEGLAVQYNNGTKKYFAYHYDNIGSTTLITAKDGHAVERFSYGTYGELLKDPITKIRFLYNGSYGVATDSNGLYYMRARYYNPDIKRFINQDIKAGDIGNSQSLNRYAYCEGNPVSMVDPFGLCGENANLWKNFWSNFTIHDWLAFAGFALNFAGPAGVVLAAVCDVVNAAIYFKEGDPVQGAISLACAVPGIGDAVGAVKSGTQIAKNLKTVGNVIRSAQKLYVTTASASKALDLAGDAKLEYAANGGEMTASVRAKILSAVTLAGMAAISGKSLAKDVRSFAKTAEIRFNTTSKETADAVCGKNVQYSGVGCFVAGTIVATRDGEENIEDIRKGDYVLAENPETGEQEYKKVVRTFIHEKYLLVHIYAEDEEIITTEEHPFYVEGTGFVTAGELQCGDILRLADGRKIPVKQKGFEYLEEPVLVYNFEVEDFHTYYVSGLGVLVHNDCSLESGSDISFRDMMTPEEAARYDRYWSQGTGSYQGVKVNGKWEKIIVDGEYINTRQRMYTNPGTRSIMDVKLGSNGEMYYRETIFDDFGRKIGHNDYTNHGRPDIPSHTNPHYHPNPVNNPSQHGGGIPGLHPQTPR